jgi:hypothetical protein
MDNVGFELEGFEYHRTRVVCVTLVPCYEEKEYKIDAAIETKVDRLVTSLGPNCRVSKFQWMVATQEPCGAIAQDLDHEGIQNVFVFAALIGTDWKFCCKPLNAIDEWEFDGLGAFLQQELD